MLKVSHYCIFLVVAVFTFESTAFAPKTSLTLQRSLVGSLSTPTPQSLPRRLKEDSNDDEGKDEPITREERSRREEEAEASTQIMDSLQFPQRVGSAITGAAIAFLVIEITLNQFGYGLYRPDTGGMLTVDTLERRNFQVETRKSMKDQSSVEPPALVDQ
jgi:hypothetical protein